MMDFVNKYKQELLQNEISSNLNQLNAEISAAADGIKEFFLFTCSVAQARSLQQGK